MLNKMVSVNSSSVINSPLERVWDIVSEVDRDSEYWKGVRSIRNIRKEENLVERSVKVGFMGNEGLQTIKLTPKKSIELIMTKGPLKGKRQMKLEPLEDGNKTNLSVSWDFQFSGVPIFARAFVKSQIEGATEEALEKIARASEAHEIETSKVTLKTQQIG